MEQQQLQMETGQYNTIEHNLIANMVFSQVIGTLSGMVQEVMPESPDKFLNKVLNSEKVVVYHNLDTGSYCVSGSLDDLVHCRQKLLRILFPGQGRSDEGSTDEVNEETLQKENEREMKEEESQCIGNDKNLHLDNYQQEDGGISELLYAKTKDNMRNNTTRHDSAIQCNIKESEEIKKSASAQSIKGKARSSLSIMKNIEDNEEEMEEVEEETPIVSKSGRAIKRPSKFRNLLILKSNSDDVLSDSRISGTGSGILKRNKKGMVQNNFLNKGRRKTNKNLQKISVEEVRRLVEEEKARELKDNPDTTLSDDRVNVDLGDKQEDRDYLQSDLHILDTQYIEKKRLLKKEYEDKMPFKYFCDICSFKTKRVSHFENHQNFHRKNPNLPLHQCDQCNFKAVRYSVVQTHKKEHETGLLRCEICERYVTSNEKQLAKHKKSHKKNRSSLPLLACQRCSFQTLSKMELMAHVELHGPGSGSQTQPLFQCNQCSYKTHRKEHLVRHKNNVHSNRRPYLCDNCGASFKRLDALACHKTTHLEKHQRKLPYTCTQCKKAFKSQAHLKEHMSVHSTTRSYQCHICGQMFKTRAVQIRHQQTIHFNPRAHKCLACNKDFNTKYALQRHVRTHEDDLITRPMSDDNMAPLGQQFDGVAGGKDQGVLHEELVDENISAIQTITIGSDSQLQGADVGEVYTVQGLTSEFSIVNFEGRQILIPVTDGDDQDAVSGESVKQYIITQQPGTSWALQEADMGTNSSDTIVRHIVIPTSSDGVGNLVPDLREVHVQLSSGESSDSVKHILIPASSIEAGNGTSSVTIEQVCENNENLQKKGEEGRLMEQTLEGDVIDTSEQTLEGDVIDSSEVSDYDLKVENGQTLLTLSSRFAQNT